MPEQKEVLKLISERSDRGKSTTFQVVAEEYDLDEAAACGHLKRLWRERLIEAIEFRPPRFKFQLTPGESVRDLHFKIAARGNARLEWIEEQEEWL